MGVNVGRGCVGGGLRGVRGAHAPNPHAHADGHTFERAVRRARAHGHRTHHWQEPRTLARTGAGHVTAGARDKPWTPHARAHAPGPAPPRSRASGMRRRRRRDPAGGGGWGAGCRCGKEGGWERVSGAERGGAACGCPAGCRLSDGGEGGRGTWEGGLEPAGAEARRWAWRRLARGGGAETWPEPCASLRACRTPPPQPRQPPRRQASPPRVAGPPHPAPPAESRPRPPSPSLAAPVSCAASVVPRTPSPEPRQARDPAAVCRRRTRRARPPHPRWPAGGGRRGGGGHGLHRSPPSAGPRRSRLPRAPPPTRAQRRRRGHPRSPPRPRRLALLPRRRCGGAGWGWWWMAHSRASPIRVSAVAQVAASVACEEGRGRRGERRGEAARQGPARRARRDLRPVPPSPPPMRRSRCARRSGRTHSPRRSSVPAVRSMPRHCKMSGEFRRSHLPRTPPTPFRQRRRFFGKTDHRTA